MSIQLPIRVKLKHVGPVQTPVPAYSHAGDAGVDLYAAINFRYIMGPGEHWLCPTGIAIALPPGYEAQVRPRSGLALKHGITVLNTPGTVDPGYRGEIGVILINHGGQQYTIEPLSRIAQLVFNRVEQAVFQVVDDLDATGRGDGGYGSSGI